jgi:hypothetical protein
VKVAACLLVTALAGSPVFAAQTTAAQTNHDKPFPWQPEEPQGYWTQTWHDGFRAGATAANADVHDELPPDPERHAQYSQPDLAPMANEDFRDGFQAAYELVRDHFAHRQ